jgi:hypothetical protein
MLSDQYGRDLTESGMAASRRRSESGNSTGRVNRTVRPCADNPALGSRQSREAQGGSIPYWERRVSARGLSEAIALLIDGERPTDLARLTSSQASRAREDPDLFGMDVGSWRSIPFHRVRRRSKPRFSTTKPWRIGRDARAMDHTPPRCEYLLTTAANAQRTCVCAEDALLAADDGTAAVRMLRYIETDGKRRTFARLLHGTMAGGSLQKSQPGNRSFDWQRERQPHVFHSFRRRDSEVILSVIARSSITSKEPYHEQ